MGVLGKDLLDLDRPITHAKVQFGERGYWVEWTPVPRPYGYILTELLNFDASGYLGRLSDLEEAIVSKDRVEIVKAFYELLRKFIRLPFYSIFVLDYGALEPALMEVLLEGISEFQLSDRILADDGTIMNKYRWAGEDLRLIQERYAWFLDSMMENAVFEKKKGQRKESLAALINGKHLEPFVSGTSLGASRDVDAPQVNIQYAIIENLEHNQELVEKMYFDRLADFVYVELMKGLQKGFVPKRCANCGRWFLQRPGATYNYCSETAPGEETKTCRDIGAAASFQEKVKNNEIWSIHQRAYKKYFARAKKGTMEKSDFEAWSRDAEVLRNKALEQYEDARTASDKAAVAAELKQKLNQV